MISRLTTRFAFGHRTIRLTITPKLRLREDDKKALLSCILKLRLPGIRCISRSTQMMLEPNTHAGKG